MAELAMYPSLTTLAIALAFLHVTACGANERLQYNRDILPILAEHCFACHGFDKASRQANLRFDLRSSALTAQDGKTPIKPHEPDQSELIKRIFEGDADLVMPPPKSGKQLTTDQKTKLKVWIEQGAEYERHWAYIAPQQITPPPISSNGRSPIDQFIGQQLQRQALVANDPADRTTLIRRLALDLTGMPPSREAIDAFLDDSHPNAFEKWVDRLLSSAHFGERWGRWWLDMAHYADSDGYLQDFLRPHAWRYRQWVIDALNEDMPFDQFTIEQLAGDLLPNATDDQRIATGFLRNTLSNREGGADLEEYRVRQAVDRTVTTSLTWLALTVGCAECHDHKFDAVSQREFYQLYDFFNNCDEANIDAPDEKDKSDYRAALEEYQAKRDAILAGVIEELETMQLDWEKRLLDAETNPGVDHRWDRALEVLGLIWGQGNGEGQLEGLNIVKTPWKDRTPDQRNRLLDYFLSQAPSEYSVRLAALKVGELQAELKALAGKMPQFSRPQTIVRAIRSRPTKIHLRGDFRRKGEDVSANTPAILPRMAINAESAMDRLQLARWLVSRENPLTARVVVNRLWQELFGVGIVKTSDNFGIRGDTPSHPELLDWLAVELMRNQWSLKQLIRHIVLSSTYQQSSATRPEQFAIDPSNRWLARQNRLRLSAEGIRDSSLSVSGLIDATIGGPSVRPPQPDSVSMEGFSNEWRVSEGGNRYRRGIYTFIQRTSPFAPFVTFDLPDSSRFCSRRDRTNTPLQSLNLLNDPVMLHAARTLADRLQRESAVEDLARIQFAVRCVLGRQAKPQELETMADVLVQHRAELSTEKNLENEWTMLVSILLNLDEFITRE
jgi:Protein of unknown function (DUF1553)/Protein of unknown function (DUF1549)/Planctomycete cytochrome C